MTRLWPTFLWRLAIAASAALIAVPALAGGTYDEGASDTEIKIGNTMPYSGPVSMYGVIGKAEAAYFQMRNETGGINGRKITFLSYDDAYSPPKTVEQVRKLVESDKVLLMFGTVGSPTNSAVMKYLNGKKVPQLFLATGATKFGDPQNYPWTMGFIPNYATEAATYAKAIVANHPDAKIAVLYQNDDFGKDYLNGFKQGLGDKAGQIIASAPYETSQPTIDSQIVNLKGSGADVLLVAAIGKFASQTIRKVGELGWKPAIYLTNTAVGVETVLKPAGLDHAKGIVSAAYRKDATDPLWANDPDMKEYVAFMEKYLPNEPKNDQSVYGYIAAQAIAHVLENAGDNLTRENVMRVAASMQDVKLKLLLPGIAARTSATDYFPLDQFQLMRFNGAHWELFGSVQSQ
jgi:ABC-type branched-subunit amino acid transport system substrate-binding protein